MTTDGLELGAFYSPPETGEPVVVFNTGHPMVIFDESLRAAVAIEVAVAHPPAAVILRSPFTSSANVARQHYRLTPAPFPDRELVAGHENIEAIDRFVDEATEGQG